MGLLFCNKKNISPFHRRYLNILFKEKKKYFYGPLVTYCIKTSVGTGHGVVTSPIAATPLM